MRQIPCPLVAASRAGPEQIAMIDLDRGREWTFSQLDQQTGRAAGRLEARGIGAGARVGIVAADSPDDVLAILALWRLGATVCPLSPRLPPATLAARLEQIGAHHRLPVFEELSAADPSSPCIDGPEEVAANQAATILFTSGSAGEPKAVLHTHGNHYYSALGANQNMPLTAGDRWLLSLPLYHVGGLAILCRCLLAGAAVATGGAGLALTARLRRGRATHVSLVPTQLRRLLADDDALPALKAVLLGGAPMPADLVRQAVARGLPLHLSYGSTEMASQITTTPPGGATSSGAGQVLEYRELRIEADGEILARGPVLAAGHAAAGWFHTGDLGRLDANGCLHVLGRRDRMFISGGENIQPEEVERALAAAPEVEFAAVVPIDDDEFGRRPVAFVRLTPGAALEPDRLAAALAATLPRFMIPIAFHPWPQEDEGPMKTDCQRLRQLAAELRHRA